ncbi:MAG: amino acid adenylation domain-containing protein, partial [Bacteroidota bacterium]
QLIDRHESLRTTFKVVDNLPMQQVSKAVPFEVEHHTAKAAEVTQIIKRFIRPFDLHQAPLLRVGLVKLTESTESHLLMVDMHHIITDGVSQGVLINDFKTLYERSELPPLRLHYKDYAEWQQSPEQQERIAAQRSFWMELYSEEVTPLDLPTDYERPLVTRHEGDTYEFGLGKEETQQLKSLAERTGVTMYTVMLSVFTVMLSKLGNQEDIVVGTPVAGRQHADLEGVIGMFVNTLPLRNRVAGGQRFDAFLSEVQSGVLACFEHQEYPYEELIDALRLERTLNRHPLFDVMLAYQNFEASSLELPDLTLSSYSSAHKVSKFDLVMIVTEVDDELSLSFGYSTELFKEETIKRFAHYFKNLVKNVISTPSAHLSALEVMGQKERRQLLEDFNATTAEYPRDGSIVSLFETQAQTTPENKAIIYEDKVLNYQQTSELSNQIAHYLIALGVKSGDLVGIMVERDEHLVPLLFGIMKSGAAYVPIDPGYPEERKNAIANDAGLKALISRSSYLESSLANTIQVVNLDAVMNDITSLAKSSCDVHVSGQDLAYVIYTSGSTGRPKGVMIEHHSVVNRILWMQKEYPLGAQDVLLQKTPIVFDVSVWELFWWSFTGASLTVLGPGEEKDAYAIIKTISEYHVSIIHFVPSMLQAFMSVTSKGSHYEDLKSLNQVFASGEALKAEYVQIFGKTLYRHCSTRLINLYGPTEATVDVSSYECDFTHETSRIPIGKPIDNIMLYVMDRSGEIAPIGVQGELCISGVGLARGYINNDKLTAQKFVNHPVYPGRKMYKTGDVVRWLPDGNIEFIGRKDDQIKIRGFRIELGDIEHHLLEHKQINTSVVAVKTRDTGPYLIAYCVSNAVINADQLRQYLLKKLPEYMVPAHYVFLKELPLTVNGKVNRKALPFQEMTAEEDYFGPSNEIEAQLVELWSETLKLEREVISVNKSFFELGGHSLLSMNAIQDIHATFRILIPLKTFFQLGKLNEIARYIKIMLEEEQQEEAEFDSIEL